MSRYGNIEERNFDALFNDCFSQLVIYLLEYFGSNEYVSAFCLLCPYISTEKRRTIFTGPALTQKDFEFLLTNAGITHHIKPVQKDIVSYLIQDLKLHRLVMLTVDCFYDENYKYTFGRIHKKHYILILKYNKNNETFDVLKHDYLKENHYYIKQIPARSLALYYNLSKKYINDFTYMCFYENNWHRKRNSFYAMGYILYIINRYRAFLRVIDNIYQSHFHQIKMKTDNFTFYTKLFNQIFFIKKRIAKYYKNNFPQDHFICLASENVAMTWKKFLTSLLDLKKTMDERFVMKMQIYYEELVWQEEQLVIQVKDYYEQKFGVS